MDNKTKNTFYLKTTFWTQARVIVPVEAETAEAAAELFRNTAEDMFGVSIRDLEIEEVAADLETFADVMDDPDTEPEDENKKLH